MGQQHPGSCRGQSKSSVKGRGLKLSRKNKTKQCDQTIMAEWGKGQDEYVKGGRKTNADP